MAQSPGSNAQSIIASDLTRTTLASSIDSAGRITLTATVVTERGGGVPGGTVRFVDETNLTLLGWADVASPSVTVDHLSEGLHRFRASYGGTADFLPVMVQPSQSTILVHTTRAAPGVLVSSSDNPSASGAVVTLTATITGRGGIPKGAVTFRDGDHVLAAHVGLDRAGAASFTTSALADGARKITAEYEGDAMHASAASSALVQDVGMARIRSSQLLQDP
jgi:hypothetical protein